MPLALVEQVRREGGPAAVELYRIIRADVVALSALPYDLNEIHRLAGRDPETFDRYWADGSSLDAVTGVIEDGIDAGASTPPCRRTPPSVVERRKDPELPRGSRAPRSRRGDRQPADSAGPHAIGTSCRPRASWSFPVDPRGSTGSGPGRCRWTPNAVLDFCDGADTSVSFLAEEKS